MDPSDGRSTFSNFGNGLVTLAAAGEALITTFPGGGYAAAWGTSFSSALPTFCRDGRCQLSAETAA